MAVLKNCLILNSNSIINLKLDTYVKSIILSTDLTFLANLVILSFFLAIFYAIITRYEFVDPKFEFTINSRLNTYFKSITRSTDLTLLANLVIFNSFCLFYLPKLRDMIY